MNQRYAESDGSRARAAVLAAGGFAKIGEKGRALQAELDAVIATSGIRVLGPNTSGHTSMPAGFTSAFFPLGKMPRGRVSYIAQTSNFATHTMRYIMSTESFGVARVIGLGNKVDVDESEARYLDKPILVSFTGKISHFEAAKAWLESRGIPCRAFLAFMNNSVMGSMFTAYKSPAPVNLDWTTTFTPELLRKALDLGLELGRAHDVPVTAAARETVQAHFGAALLQKDPGAYLAKDFAALAETMALMSGMTLESEGKNVPSGLET